ncbi:uncharacterized protein LOC144357708 [Saccoglossus kowalevskii]
MTCFAKNSEQVFTELLEAVAADITNKEAESSYQGHEGKNRVDFKPAAEESSSQTIPAFRILLNEISDGLSPDKVEEMKNLLIDKQLLRKDENKIKNGMGLFIYLESTGAISDNNVDLLVELLTLIGRQPLGDKLRNAISSSTLNL